MAQTLEQILASRKSIYDPQRALIAQQQGQLPGQEQADVQGLETAKTNAFGDITAGANAKGMIYSGAPIQEQSRYVGERYLPALAGVKNQYADRRSKLEAALLGINQDEITSAQQMQQAQQKDEYDYAIAQQKLAQDRQQGLNMASLFGGANRQSQVDPVSAARGFAKTAKAQLLAAGNVQPFAREAVLRDLQSQFGLDDKTARQIIYKELFPDSWAGTPGKAMIPYSPQYKASQQGIMGSLGYGGKF